MELRSLFKSIFGSKKAESGYQRLVLLSDNNNLISRWSGVQFDSDIIRAAIRPKTNAIGKLNPKHLRGDGASMRINPDPRIRAVLERPNPHMSMQDLLMKMTCWRELYHNAFAYVKYDAAGIVSEIYPVPFSSAEALEKGGETYIKFWFNTGHTTVIPYANLIHLRKDFFNHDLFGSDGRTALTNLLDVVTSTDTGIINAVKNSAMIKWIMSFRQVLKPSDVELQVKQFTDNYLNIDNTSGVAVGMPSYDLKEVNQNPYVPNALIIDKMVQRLWSYFGVNDAIVQNKYDENQWNAFYEAEIEPVARQLSEAFSFAFFSARERGFGNRIIFESSSLQYASMTTKLGLVQMVDRGAMTPNEWRTVLNLGPIEGGDKPIRRLDTVPVKGGDGNEPNGED